MRVPNEIFTKRSREAWWAEHIFTVDDKHVDELLARLLLLDTRVTRFDSTTNYTLVKYIGVYMRSTPTSPYHLRVAVYYEDIHSLVVNLAAYARLIGEEVEYDD